jgi:hypothetical protein
MLIEDIRYMICDRYTPEELIELLGVTVEEVFDRFQDEVMNLDLEEILL